MNVIEQIRTTKGAYTLTMQIVEHERIAAIVGIDDRTQENFIALDREDLRRIKQLIEDHENVN